MALQRLFLLCNHNPDVYVQLTVKCSTVKAVLADTISFSCLEGKLS